jgi:hypothetical protein
MRKDVSTLGVALGKWRADGTAHDASIYEQMLI